MGARVDTLENGLCTAKNLTAPNASIESIADNNKILNVDIDISSMSDRRFQIRSLATE